MLALGIIIPVLPKLVVGFVGGDTARARRIFGLFGTVWALMQFCSRRCRARCRTGSGAAR